MTEFTSIELFAGAGGMALGLESAGFTHLGLVEFDKHAAQTLKTNRPTWNVLCEDVAQVASRDLEKEFNIKKGELDLLSGGAPCQSFSYLGKRLGLEDTRGTMFYYFATFLHKLKPKMFLFENVRGLLGHDGGRTYETIRNVFEEQGYDITYKVMNAWDYGVPQARLRLITIGIRKDLSSTKSFSFPKEHDYKPVLRDVKLDVNPSKKECMMYSDRTKSYISLVPPGGNWKSIPVELAKEYAGNLAHYIDEGRCPGGLLRRLHLDKPSPTIVCRPHGNYACACHPIEVRPLSVRECARIQTFPDDWVFCGGRTTCYKQIGNAVPVLLAKEIGLEIIKTLKG